MCEVPVSDSETYYDFKQRPDPPIVVTQHNEKPRKFVFINSQVIKLHINFLYLWY